MRTKFGDPTMTRSWSKARRTDSGGCLLGKIWLSPGFQTSKIDRKKLKPQKFSTGTVRDHRIEAPYQI